ncbi:MAG: bifunctional phosphoribosylaminoimidazolecarboxamide formyltransferase/IMP cyclohydrolase PurH [Proteobacteria bacterium]|nr:bifunctional phosphoribosylaminoimidazolecarboxamide formyltransferase/IMP cyclohydrolase PurH [Pseudomonadota bacterium]
MNVAQNLQKIKRCLISVSDKTGIVELAQYLSSQGVEIISTGGTSKLLTQNKISNKDISEFTGFPEMMDGRVKTLHPKVHAGLLAVLDNPAHLAAAKDHKIESIDLLIINLYPFFETVAKTNDEEEIIENIDIGGPAMVRSASKNFVYKTVITDAAQYQNLIEELKNNSGATSFEFRKKLAAQAFKNIADYDSAISNWFNKTDFFVSGSLKQNLRYGENSHQKAALYATSNSGIVGAKQLQGKELSYNNLNDADAAYNLVLEFEKPACAIIKHANPCGTAIASNLLQAYKRALSADSKSAFGGIVALNGKIDEALATELSKMFFEVIIAREIDTKAAEILASKKNLRLLLADFKKSAELQIKSVSGGFLVQDLDQKNINKNDLKLVSKKSVSDSEIEQLIFAMSVCKHVKSNAIVVVQDFQTVGIGAGQMSRVDSCEIACKKAAEFFDGERNINKAKGGFLASDAFFPFADNIEIAAARGIKAIIAPSGSMRDEEVIAKADEKGVALYFIATRHFRH